MKLRTLCHRYDRLLRTADFVEIDSSANGLQVGSLDAPIESVAFAVDAAVETIDSAADAGADLLVVHHGLSWGGIERVTGRQYARIATLIENDVSLYVSHLPLDGHPILGNAAGVAAVLDLIDQEPFGTLGGEYVGCRGRLSDPTGIDVVCNRLEDCLDDTGNGVQVLDFGPTEIETVAIVTGSGTDWIDEAVSVGADVLITGEGKQQAYHEANESALHVVLAGHYATETFGVRSLQRLTEEWGLETKFIAVPTGL